MAYHSAYTDHELFALLQNDDSAAYQAIYDRHWQPLYRHARKMLQNDEEARDVVQDIFVALWDKRYNLELTTSLSAYLYASTRNKILSLFKHRKVEETHLLSLKAFIEQGENVTDHLVREKMLAEIIEKETCLLPERMRQVFELKRKNDLSYKQIAEEMAISDLTVKTQMNKAMKTLRLRLTSALSCFL